MKEIQGTTTLLERLDDLAEAYPHLPTLRQAHGVFSRMLREWKALPDDYIALKSDRDELLAFRSEVSAKVGCASPDGHAELDQIELAFAQVAVMRLALEFYAEQIGTAALAEDKGRRARAALVLPT